MLLSRRRRRSPVASLALAGVLALAVLPGQEAAQAAPPPAPKQPTATGYGGAVASLDPYATEAGLEILRHGGNAIDAAVAASATLGVTRPYDGSIGGGGFMVIRSGETGEVTTIDSRETAAASVKPDHFIDPETGEPLPFSDARVSGLSVGVPGLVRGWEKALSEYGTMPLERVLKPATATALGGFTVDAEYQRRTEDNLDILRTFTSSRETFLVGDGEAPEAGSLFRNPGLARTYQLLARHGASAFYKGEIADAIAGTVTSPPVVPGSDRTVRPGQMTAADLTGYKAVQREPTHLDYRGYDIYGMSPPSSGGSTVGESLNILEGFDLVGMEREEALHHLIESSALSFADRNAYLGDSDFVDVPLKGLLSQDYADERRSLITPRAAAKPVAPGDPWPYNGGDEGPARTEASAAPADGSTTHLTVADKYGNVVSYTFTIESIGGSGMAVPGYGFLLNNELTDFSFDPEHPANAPAGSKRPRSSISPTIVLSDGRPVAALGSPGGATIIPTVLQVLLNHLDFGMSLSEAIARPRLYNLNGPATSTEEALLRTPEAEALRRRGHQLTGIESVGNVTGVAFLPGGRMQAAAEPVRFGGGSAGVVRPSGN